MCVFFDFNTTFFPKGTYVSGGSSSASCTSGIWTPTLGTCGTGIGIGTTGSTGLYSSTTTGGCLASITPFNGQIQYSNVQYNGLYPSGTLATLICTGGMSYFWDF
jgi:hypothetical protein